MGGDVKCESVVTLSSPRAEVATTKRKLCREPTRCRTKSEDAASRRVWCGAKNISAKVGCCEASSVVCGRSQHTENGADISCTGVCWHVREGG